MTIVRRENLNRKILHIGMGKNGSTYLQKWVFRFCVNAMALNIILRNSMIGENLDCQCQQRI